MCVQLYCYSWILNKNEVEGRVGMLSGGMLEDKNKLSVWEFDRL